MSQSNSKLIIEAALMSADRPLTPTDIQTLFVHDDKPSIKDIKAALTEMQQDYESRAFGLFELASGYRFQVKAEYAENIVKLWEEKPAKYTRAYLETLSIIAYRQPITRSEIESIRGVAVSSTIMKTLQEREWVKLIGHRDVPGKPGIYGTTKEFLDYFNLSKLDDLPTLQELRDLDEMAKEVEQPQLPLEEVDTQEVQAPAETIEELDEQSSSGTDDGESQESVELIPDVVEDESFETNEDWGDAEAEATDQIEALAEAEA